MDLASELLHRLLRGPLVSKSADNGDNYLYLHFSVKRDQYCSTEEYFDAVEKKLNELYQPASWLEQVELLCVIVWSAAACSLTSLFLTRRFYQFRLILSQGWKDTLPVGTNLFAHLRTFALLFVRNVAAQVTRL